MKSRYAIRLQDTGANTPLNSTHPGGVNVLYCDGTVRFLMNDTALNVLAAMATRDDEVQ